MNFVDNFLDRITMYRLVLYVLLVYVALAVLFSFTGKLSYEPTHLVLSLGLIVVPAFIADKVASWYFKAPTNSETWIITSIIMFFVIQPAHTPIGAVALMVAGTLSSLSKFLVTWNNKHIFNPAALGAAVVGLTGLQPTTWWIGNSIFWPFTLLLGLAVVRKIRRAPLFITFAAVSIGLQLVLLIMHQQPIMAGMKETLIASPLLFLSTIMLTEPATMPPRRRGQIIFAALAAVLYIMAWQFGPLVVYPEVALLIANAYAFLVSPKFRVRLHLQEVQRISEHVYNYVFRPEKPFNFLPGQYMEWTLAGVPFDSRGNRRTLTIASSPTEDNVQIGVKYYYPASAYKAKLASLQPGDVIYASQLAGNFTIKPKSNDKLAFIAGGIGITPFRSILKYLIDNQLQRDITMLYIVPTADEVAYKRDLVEAQQYGIRTIPIVTRETSSMSGVVNAKFDQALLAELIPDYAERTFYVSGPSTMVDATKQYLKNLGLTKRHIKTDHFTGY